MAVFANKWHKNIVKLLIEAVNWAIHRKYVLQIEPGNTWHFANKYLSIASRAREFSAQEPVRRTQYKSLQAYKDLYTQKEEPY